MAWFSRFTRFGDAHLVYGQEAGMSCGIASVIMCVFKINKLRPGAQAVQVEKDIYAKYSTASGGAYKPETQGTNPNHLVTVLNSLNCGKWTWKSTSGAAASKLIIDKVGVTGLGPQVQVNPIIAAIKWSGPGGHGVVIDTVRSVAGSKYATVCDPWDANVHVTSIDETKAFNYDAGKGGFHVNVWGSTKATGGSYSSKGANMWVVHRI